MDIPLILDLNSKIPSALVSAKQGDKNGRRLIVSFTQDGENYNLPEGTQAAFRLRKPDNTVVYNTTYSTDTNMELDDNQVIIVLTEQALAVPGRGYADVILQNNKFETVSTSPFILDVVSSPDIGSQIISGNEFGYLQSIVEQSDDIVNAARKWAIGNSLSAGSDISYGPDNNQATISYNPSTNVMTISSNGGSDSSTLEPSDTCNAFYFSNLAESWACGERNGRAIDSSAAAFQNNAKYWSDVAAAHATTASEWAAIASTSAGKIMNLDVATMSVAPTGASPSLPAVSSSVDDTYHLNFYIPPGPQGNDGADGSAMSLESVNYYHMVTGQSVRPTESSSGWVSGPPTNVGIGGNGVLWFRTEIKFAGNDPINIINGSFLKDAVLNRAGVNGDGNTPFILHSNLDYGPALPTQKVEGQLFFLAVTETASASGSGSGN